MGIWGFIILFSLLYMFLRFSIQKYKLSSKHCFLRSYLRAWLSTSQEKEQDETFRNGVPDSGKQFQEVPVWGRRAVQLAPEAEPPETLRRGEGPEGRIHRNRQRLGKLTDCKKKRWQLCSQTKSIQERLNQIWSKWKHSAELSCRESFLVVIIKSNCFAF